MEYSKLRFDEERALYGLKDILVKDCVFAGEKDGESPLKECGNIFVENSLFELRYPFWHVLGGEIKNCELTQSCRAALWYDRNITIKNSRLNGTKALRECDNVLIEDTEADSPEFGWKCRECCFKDFRLASEYPFMDCRHLKLERVELSGKYSFQYTKDAVIRDCRFKTKDAFWHSENVTVYDSVIEGEYLGWYSKNLRLVRCRIIGTQPLCYAEGLVLEDCVMEKADLSFEKSKVKASVRGQIDSVKNPRAGSITAQSIKEIILDAPTDCVITTEA